MIPDMLMGVWLVRVDCLLEMVVSEVGEIGYQRLRLLLFLCCVVDNDGLVGNVDGEGGIYINTERWLRDGRRRQFRQACFGHGQVSLHHLDLKVGTPTSDINSPGCLVPTLGCLSQGKRSHTMFTCILKTRSLSGQTWYLPPPQSSRSRHHTRVPA